LHQSGQLRSNKRQHRVVVAVAVVAVPVIN
jgi:hypothetical protein